MRDTYGMLDACRAEFGDTFTLRLGSFPPMILCDDPARIHDVFTADPAIMLAGQGNDVLAPFLGEHSLLTMDGARHARDRRLLTPPFHGQRMRAHGRIIQEAALRATAAWRPGEEVATHTAMQAASLEVILRAVFGVTDARLEEARLRITALLDGIGPALVFVKQLRVDLGRHSPWGRYLRDKLAAERLLREIIAERRERPGEDILSLLLQARDESGAPLTEAELRGELNTLLAAGHETTATALAWAFAWLGAEPAVAERLAAEIDGAGDDPDVLAKLPYLGAFCSEVLRINPVFPIVVRVLGAPWSWGGWQLDTGMRVAPCVYLAHQRPDTFPEPRRFRPERFLERTFGPDEFFPFGGGARRCIGSAFALYEMKIVLATVLRRFRFQAVTPGPPKAERRHIAIGPAGGAPVRIRELRPT
jgi:cytochrome P450